MILASMIGILVSLIPVILIVIIITAIVRHNKNTESKETVETFEKTIRAIFVYFILIVLLCAIIGGTIYLFNSIINIILPEEQYPDSYYDKKITTSISNINLTSTVDNSERNENIVNMITATSLLTICIPLFIYYSKIAKKDIVKKK